MSRQILATIAIGILILALTAFGMQRAKKGGPKKSIEKKPAAALTVTYKKDVYPILKKYCLPCHTEDEMNPSQLYLDTYENMSAGGKHGKPFVPGKADSSLMIQKISGKAPFGDPMPMKRKTPFPEDTLKMLERWIDQGAKDN